MKPANISVIAVLLLCSVASIARPPRAVMEDGREITAAMLSLPSAVGGIVSIQGCTACKRVSLTLGADAQFFVNKQEVTFGEFRRYLQDHPAANVLVVSPVNVLVVSRISASAQ